MQRIAICCSLMLTLLVAVSCGGGNGESNSLNSIGSSTSSPTIMVTGDIRTGQLLSDTNGEALVPLGANEARVILENESDRSLITDAQVSYASFNEGTLIWAHGDDIFPVYRFIPTTTEAQGIRTRTPQLAVTTLVVGVVAAATVNNFIHQFSTDPPDIIDVIESDITQKRCLTGDVNDILAAWGFKGAVKGISTIIRVLGAPAAIRRVTAINFGVRSTRAQFALERTVIISAVSDAIKDFTNIKDDDIIVGCVTVVGGQELPLIELDVERPSGADSNVTDGAPVVTGYVLSSDNCRLTIEFSTEMFELTFTGDYTASRSYQGQAPSQIVIEFESYVPDGRFTLVAANSTSINGMRLNEDLVLMFGSSPSNCTNNNEPNSLVGLYDWTISNIEERYLHVAPNGADYIVTYFVSSDQQNCYETEGMSFISIGGNVFRWSRPELNFTEELNIIRFNGNLVFDSDVGGTNAVLPVVTSLSVNDLRVCS